METERRASVRPFRTLLHSQVHSSPKIRSVLLAETVLKINDPKGIYMDVNFNSVIMEHLLRENK